MEDIKDVVSLFVISCLQVHLQDAALSYVRNNRSTQAIISGSDQPGEGEFKVYYI